MYEPSEIDLMLDDSESVYSIISKISHIPLERIIEEQHRREVIINWMVKKDFKTYESVSTIIRNYYADPDKIYNQARLEFP